jgi:acyl-coenzyme A synthetase/AMP-(fatty) acid ligase
MPDGQATNLPGQRRRPTSGTPQDTQVKIRGYRIELTEIESVLPQVPGIAQAEVGTYQSEPGTVELVAYYSRRQDAPVDQELVYQQLRSGFRST